MTATPIFLSNDADAMVTGYIGGAASTEGSYQPASRLWEQPNIQPFQTNPRSQPDPVLEQGAGRDTVWANGWMSRLVVFSLESLGMQLTGLLPDEAFTVPKVVPGSTSGQTPLLYNPEPEVQSAPSTWARVYGSLFNG